MPHGLLLINLGTPDEPTTGAVRRYLREFLGDPRVLDINPVGRALLLNLIILPTRPAKSAHAYRLIWDPERGSPLLYHSQDLAAGVAAALGDDWQVELAMRYGRPSIAAALDALIAAGTDRIVVLPLFPQYASSSTGTAVARVMELAGAQWNVPALDVVPAFFDDAGFLDAFAAVGAPGARGRPRPTTCCSRSTACPSRQITKTDTAGTHCFASASCCDTLGQPELLPRPVLPTARSLADPARAAPGPLHGVLPVAPRPHAVDRAVHRRRARPARGQGVKRLAVLCPAFVADCLETLEEIGMRAQAQFTAAGGEELVLVPSLNSSPAVDRGGGGDRASGTRRTSDSPVVSGA